MIDIVISDTSK